MSLGVSITDPLYDALKLSEVTTNDSSTATTTTTTPNSDNAQTLDGFPSLPLREKTNLLRGKNPTGYHHQQQHHYPLEGTLPSPLTYLSKIDDGRSHSWPSADKKTTVGDADDHRNHVNGLKEAGEEQRRKGSLATTNAIGEPGKPCSWPCSPLVKVNSLFNKDTTFKEGLGVPINYAEGRNSLTHVLDSIQLCYNPSSKQLHRVQQQQQQHHSQPGGDTPSPPMTSSASSSSSSSAASSWTVSDALDQRTSHEPTERLFPLHQRLNAADQLSRDGLLNSSNDNLHCDKPDDLRSSNQQIVHPAADDDDVAAAKEKTQNDVSSSPATTDGASDTKHTTDCLSRVGVEASIGSDDGSSLVDSTKIIKTTASTTNYVEGVVYSDSILEADVAGEFAALEDELLESISTIKIDPDDIITSLRPEESDIPSEEVETCAKQLSTHQRQLDARSQQRHQRQRQVQQQQQLSRGGVSDNEASSVSSCFSSASGESILFTHASEGLGHDGENRSDTDSAFQTDESNFSSLRNSLDHAPLTTTSSANSATVACLDPPPLTNVVGVASSNDTLSSHRNDNSSPEEAPATPTTTTNAAAGPTQTAFSFDPDGEDAQTLRSGSVDDTLASAEETDADGNNAVSERDTTEAKSDVESLSQTDGKNDLENRPSEVGCVLDPNKAGIPVVKKTGITGFLARGFFSRKKSQPPRLPDSCSSSAAADNQLKKLETDLPQNQQQQHHHHQQQQQQQSGWRLLPRSITASRMTSPLAFNPPQSHQPTSSSGDASDSDAVKIDEVTMPSSLSTTTTTTLRPSSSSSSLALSSPKKVLGTLRGSMIGSTNSLTTDEVVASSTTALILQPRPANLPPKSLEEEQKHRQLYEEMVQEAKKREVKDVKLKRKQAAERLKVEDARAEAVKIWLNDILPNWERERHARRTKDLWWQGLPSAVRGKVWRLAIGNDLNITAQLYEICALRALKLMAAHEAKRRENREAFQSQNGTPKTASANVERGCSGSRSTRSDQPSTSVSPPSSPYRPAHPSPVMHSTPDAAVNVDAAEEASSPPVSFSLPDNEQIASSESVGPTSSSTLPDSVTMPPSTAENCVTTSQSIPSSQSERRLDDPPCADIQSSPSWPSFALSPPESLSTADSAEFASPFDREGTVDLIRLDVSRTFPHLCIFQEGGPYYDMLHSLLGAYATYRPDVGYVQGMSFLAAFLLLNMDVADAFISFANLLNRPCQLAFFRMDESLMKIYFSTFEEFFRENLPKLCQHFVDMTFLPEMYLLDWIFTIFCKSLPLDVACRVWDVFLRDGDEFLFRAALGILSLFQEELLQLDFIQLGQFLSKLPESIDADAFFKAIEGIHMVLTSTTQKTFSSHVAAQKDLVLMKAETSSVYSTASGFSGFGSGTQFGNLMGGSMKFSMTGVSLSSTTSLHAQQDDNRKPAND